MAHSKSRDLDTLADFLKQESQRCENYKSLLEAINRIGGLASAEAEARQALEVAQIDLAWAQTELERVQAAVHSAKEDSQREIEDFKLKLEAEKERLRQQHEEERGFLDAAITQKRAALSGLALRLDEAQKAAGLLAGVLRAPAGH